MFTHVGPLALGNCTATAMLSALTGDSGVTVIAESPDASVFTLDVYNTRLHIYIFSSIVYSVAAARVE
jgi:hypothetical protein